MGAPKSDDLRERAVAAYLAGKGTLIEVSGVFGIGEATLRRWVRLYRTVGSVSPAAHGGGHANKIDDESLPLIVSMVQEQPDRTIQDLVEEWTRRTSEPVSWSTMLRTVKRAGLTFKKKHSVRPSRRVPTWRS